MDHTIVMLGSGLSASERVSTAGIVTLQGMLTIFAVLAILWGAVELMHRILHREMPKTAEKKDETAVAVTTVGDTEVDAAPATDDGAIIAAITAAITAARANEGNTGAFRVVSFKRISKQNIRRKI